MAECGLFLGVSPETWAIVAATFAGPLSAVLITRWRDKTTAIKERRLQIFRNLMATRRVTIDALHVTSLNLIEVDFFDQTEVIKAWKKYNQHINSEQGRLLHNANLQAWENVRNDLLASLLFEIGKCLGFKSMSEIDLRNGGYIPSGWSEKDSEMAELRKLILSLVKEKKTLPVSIESNSK